jgi:Sap-like sulfolipid-1-addressing protein
VNAQIIPLAVTMMAGPQIMTAIVLVTHSDAVRVSVAFLVGVAVAASLGTTIAYLLADSVDLGDPSDRGSTGTIVQYVLVGLLVLLALRTYLNRETVKPPKWLGSLQTATPRKALTMGLLLVGLMPTDIASMLTVGVNLAQNDDSLLVAVPFVALTLLIAALPLLTYLLLGRRAREAMPRVRDWMTANSWLVNIIVLGIFIVLILA